MATERVEDYLEAIEETIQKKGHARPKDIRECLDLGSSTVTEMLQKMAISGLIEYEKYQEIGLTEQGRKIARQTQKKHDMLTELLSLIGLDEEAAEEDACRIEHVLSRESTDRLSKFVDFIKHSKKTPRWLDHFDYFYRTGEYVDCSPKNASFCLVHSKKKD